LVYENPGAAFTGSPGSGTLRQRRRDRFNVQLNYYGSRSGLN